MNKTTPSGYDAVHTRVTGVASPNFFAPYAMLLPTVVLKRSGSYDVSKIDGNTRVSQKKGVEVRGVKGCHRFERGEKKNQETSEGNIWSIGN